MKPLLDSSSAEKQTEKTSDKSATKKRQSAYKRNKALDVFSLVMTGVCFAHIGLSCYQLGWAEFLRVCSLNPLLGGDAKTLRESGEQLPVFTYEVGHMFPGVVLQLLGQTVMYFATSEWKYVPSSEREDVRAFVTTVITLAASAPILGPLHKLTYESSWSKLYFEWGAIPTWAAIGSFCLASLFIESFFWWMHWFAHRNSWFYENIHSVHHSFVPSTASCASAFHPMDIVLLTLGSVFASMLLPLHHALHSGYLLFCLFWTLLVHTGFRGKFPSWLTVVLNDPNMHCLHHDYGRRPVNCGSLLCIWDHLMGSHRTELTPWSVSKGDSPASHQE